MSVTYRRLQTIVLGIILAIPPGLASLGCGSKEDAGPPPNVSSLKTPSEILKEAKEKEKAAKP